jgi:hypothetical protein
MPAPANDNIVNAELLLPFNEGWSPPGFEGDWFWSNNIDATVETDEATLLGLPNIKSVWFYYVNTQPTSINFTIDNLNWDPGLDPNGQQINTYVVAGAVTNYTDLWNNYGNGGSIFGTITSTVTLLPGEIIYIQVYDYSTTGLADNFGFRWYAELIVVSSISMTFKQG